MGSPADYVGLLSARQVFAVRHKKTGERETILFGARAMPRLQAPTTDTVEGGIGH